MRFSKAVEFIEKELLAGAFPGAGVVVVCKGEKLLERYFGTYCSQTSRDNLLVPDVYHALYSFSKGISATAIMLAHQKGFIDYDLPLYTYIPKYRGEGKDITTIRHLLTHSAGIPNCQLKTVYTSGDWKKGVEDCCNYKVEWEPGSKTEYHATSGMFLAAEAVRRVMKRDTWEEVCSELLFEPLEAKSLTFKIPEGKAVSLTRQPEKLPAALDSVTFLHLGHPGAGCFGQVEDMIKVLELHINKGVYKGQTIIQEKEFNEMHTVQYEKQIAAAEKEGKISAHSPWGLGWMIRRHLGVDHWFGLGHITSPQTFGHAGIDTVIGVGEPEKKTAMVFLTTNSPSPSGANTARIRNTVTDLIMDDIEK